MMRSFSVARLPRLEFGSGVLQKLPALVAQFGHRVLLVTGAGSMEKTAHWESLLVHFRTLHIEWYQCRIASEPSPQWVDNNVSEFADVDIDVVVGIGGGSALDAAKAIAGLLRVRRSVMDYLEGVGPELPYDGPSVPFIAVPTTAGTGSEATKNAVLSVQGKNGFKKSFRHDKLVAEYAVIDPELLATCPPALIAANGMDALTQLLESYVSLRSNSFTDALAISGIEAVRDSLLRWYEQGSGARSDHAKMAYAALLSGITLAQVGLGSVHGLASPLGAFFPIPHGVVCGTLIASATQVNIAAMREREPENPALKKYATLAAVLCKRHFNDEAEAWHALVTLLQQWTEALSLPLLSQYGISDNDLDEIVLHARGSSMKTNPVLLTDAEIRAVLAARL